MPASPLFFPRTKLLPPQLRDDFVARPRLDRLIEKAVTAHRFTLITAPAGYGKTTAALSWAKSTRDFDVLWVTLDSQDNDPNQLLRVLIAAFQQLNPTCGLVLLQTLAGQTSASRDPKRAFGIMVNEIFDNIPDPCALVLDDLHNLTTPTLFPGMDYFIANLPPQMRLLATARHDPPLALPLMRSRGYLTEIRPPELRFTYEEAVRLLENGLKLNLPEDVLLKLHHSTEGWVAGLRLLAGFSGNKGVIGGHALSSLSMAKQNVFDLLVAEVLNKQGGEIRRFMLETSILEELTPELCTRVTEHPNADLLLREVYRRNLFLSTVFDEDRGERSFRYHEMFNEFLRQQLQREMPEEVRELHHRAGAHHPDAVRAVHHLLMAEDYDLAAQRIAAEASNMFEGAMFHRLRGWIERLPETVRESYPWLVYYLGACQWVAYEHSPAVATLEKALSLFEAQSDEAGRGEALVLLSTIADTVGEKEKASRFLNAAESLPISTASRTQLNLNRAWIALEEPHQDLSASLDTALDLVETSQDPGAFHIAAMSLREFFCMYPEGRRAARRLCRMIEDRVALEQIGIPQSTYYGLNAALEYLQGNVEVAIEAADRAFAIDLQMGGVILVQGILVFLMALVQRLQEKWEQVEGHIARLEGLTNLLPGWQAGLLLPSGLIAWEQGELDKAEKILQKMELQKGVPEHAVGEFSRQVLQGLIVTRSERKEIGIRFIQKAVDMQQDYRYLYFFGDMRLALAHSYLETGDEAAALAAVRPALKAWSKVNLPGMILTVGQVMIPPVLELAVQRNIHRDFARTTLEKLLQLKGPQSLKVPTTGETLTPREVEVLRLIAVGSSNRAIADELVVSLPTVKTHVSRILAKLDVRSRGQAAALAREMRLL